MDCDKLIEELYDGAHPQNKNWKAATAIETLRADLARVTAERDGAMEEVKRLKAVMRDEGIVVIPPKYLWERAEWNI